MVQKAESHQTTTGRVTFRAVLLGLLLIPVNTYFIMANHLRFWSTLPTTMALIYNVVITLTVLIAFNFPLKRFLPHFALKQQEFLTIFVMLSISSAISGHDMMQTIVPTVPDGFWFATPENEWKALFWRYLPSWVNDKRLFRIGSLLCWRKHILYRSPYPGLAASYLLVDGVFDGAYLGNDLSQYIGSQAVDRT